jgi:hypothetical protein
MKKHRSRLIMAGLLAISAVAGLIILRAPAVYAAEPLVLTATAIPLNPEDPAMRQIGRLRYMGGLVLKSPNRGFGGISGLRAGPDGQMLAVSDTGNWVSFRVIERQELLVGAAGGVIAPILDSAGNPTAAKSDRDAEAIEWNPATGDAVISLEHDHRLEFFRGIDPARPQSFSARPWKTSRNPDTAKWPDNGGGEALAVLADGVLAVIGEVAQIGDSGFDLLLGAGKAVLTLPKDFRPTDAVLLDAPGTILLTERKVGVSGIATAISIIDTASLKVTPVARLSPPLNVDNMEGLALRRSANRLFIYLISDDNFNPWQRTLLLKFELLPG